MSKLVACLSAGLTQPHGFADSPRSAGSETVAAAEAAAKAAEIMHVVRIGGGWTKTVDRFHLTSSQLLILQELYRSLQVCKPAAVCWRLHFDVGCCLIPDGDVPSSGGDGNVILVGRVER